MWLFDDRTVPEDYPDRVGRASNQKDGRPPVTIRKRGGRRCNREMVDLDRCDEPKISTRIGFTDPVSARAGKARAEAARAERRMRSRRL